MIIRKNITVFITTLLMVAVMIACGNPAPVSEKEGTVTTDSTARTVWTAQKATAWYASQPWFVGANFLPSTAINQLEMWQKETFDTATIDKEFGWAESLGMNIMRVFLHNLVWQNDSSGFYDRMNTLLQIADKHHIKIMFAIFDSCWDPFPKAGAQHAPVPYVHNSGWVQSPGEDILKDPMQYPLLEKYVKGVVGHFATDPRIIMWDVWNEPDNTNNPAYIKMELTNKAEVVMPLLKKTFEWARSVNPTQPLTSGIWAGNWSEGATLKPMEKLQLEESDVLSFHCYDDSARLDEKINQLQRYGKPLFCTEYMARPNKSTFQTCLPVGKKYKVAMVNWGFVNGKSQTIYPWDSWTKSYHSEPPLWFHDIFRKDGRAYKEEEVAFIRGEMGKK